MLDVGGEKVAILGATTPETPEIASPGPTVIFRDPVEYLTGDGRGAAGRGRRQDHPARRTSGCTATSRVAEAVPGIDAIVGGHTHTLFSNTVADAPYKYPLMVDRPGRAAGADRAGRGLLEVSRPPARSTFDDAGNVTAATGDTMLLDASVTPDPARTRADQGAGRPDRGAEVARGRRDRRRHRRQPRDLPGGGMRDGQPGRRRDARPGARARASPSPCRTAAACAPRSAAAR